MKTFLILLAQTDLEKLIIFHEIAEPDKPVISMSFYLVRSGQGFESLHLQFFKLLLGYFLFLYFSCHLPFLAGILAFRPPWIGVLLDESDCFLMGMGACSRGHF